MAYLSNSLQPTTYITRKSAHLCDVAHAALPEHPQPPRAVHHLNQKCEYSNWVPWTHG